MQTTFSVIDMINKANEHPKPEEALIDYIGKYSGFDMNASMRIKEFAEQGIDINYKHPDSGKTALSIACQHTALSDTIEALLQNEADPNICANNHRTPLIEAIINNYPSPDIVRLLLQYKADPNLYGEKGDHALMHAVYGFRNEERQAEIIKLLIENKADINVTDQHGSSNFMHLCKKSTLENIKLALEYGANIYHKNKNKESSIEWSKLNTEHNKDGKITEFLEECKLSKQINKANDSYNIFSI